ncbi:MAG: NAD-dependent epimerase/dehydratase family protein [Armatimonadetes bacterium]|nr:NAD-dependent epimerase/dehydratase family protein [Armatimonadota bacterium]
MRALVTGGAGFIGSHICEQLIARGDEVHILDDLSNGKLANVAPGATLHEGSLCDAEFTAATVAAVKPDVIFHLAAQVSVIDSLKDMHNDLQRNVGGAINLILACRANGQPKIVYSSTGGAIYGDPKVEDLPVDETYPALPLSPYGLTKHTVERYLGLEALVHGQPYTVVRFANVYGPRQDPHGEAGVVAIFTRRILDGGGCTVFGDGEQTRDFVYVGDVARACIAAADAPDGEIFNVGTGQETTVNQVVAALRAAWDGEMNVQNAPARPGEVQRISLDITKAEKVMGWKPQVGFVEGIQMTVDSFR